VNCARSESQPRALGSWQGVVKLFWCLQFSEWSHKTDEVLLYLKFTLYTFCNNLRRRNEQRFPWDTSCTDRWLAVEHSLVIAGKQKRFERALRGTTGGTGPLERSLSEAGRMTLRAFVQITVQTVPTNIGNNCT
jgi:hypothetical protein